MNSKPVTVFGLLVCLSLASFAQSKGNNWVCYLVDPQWPWPKKSEVVISLTAPSVTRIDYILEDDGTYSEHKEDLITSATVSTYKMERSKCSISGGRSQGEFVDRYSFHFDCPGLFGRFDLDFKSSSGSYLQRLTSMNVQKAFSFDSCQEIP